MLTLIGKCNRNLILFWTKTTCKELNQITISNKYSLLSVWNIELFFVLKLTTAPSSYQWTLNVQDMCKLICLRVCFALIQNIVLASLRGVKTLTIRVISDFEFSLSWKLTLIKLFFLMQKVSHFYQISWHLFPYH